MAKSDLLLSHFTIRALSTYLSKGTRCATALGSYISFGLDICQAFSLFPVEQRNNWSIPPAQASIWNQFTLFSDFSIVVQRLKGWAATSRLFLKVGSPLLRVALSLYPISCQSLQLYKWKKVGCMLLVTSQTTYPQGMFSLELVNLGS